MDSSIMFFFASPTSSIFVFSNTRIEQKAAPASCSCSLPNVKLIKYQSLKLSYGIYLKIWKGTFRNIKYKANPADIKFLKFNFQRKHFFSQKLFNAFSVNKAFVRSHLVRACWLNNCGVFLIPVLMTQLFNIPHVQHLKFQQFSTCATFLFNFMSNNVEQCWSAPDDCFKELFRQLCNNLTEHNKDNPILSMNL